MDLLQETSNANGRDEQHHDIAIRTVTPVKRKFGEATSQPANDPYEVLNSANGEAEVFRQYLTIPDEEGSEFERPSKRRTVSRSQSIQPTTEVEDVLVQQNRVKLQAHARHLDEAYNDDYRIVLNEQIHDAMFKTNRRNLSEVSELEDSYVGGTLWRVAEKEQFFVALARYGRSFNHIASAVGKTVLEVSLYADVLAQGLEKQRKFQSGFDLQDVEGAADMPVESMEDIETAADGLAWEQFRCDIAREMKRYGDRWLITGHEEDDNGSQSESEPEEEQRNEAGTGGIWAADDAMLVAEDHKLPDPEFAESAMSPPPALPENVQELQSVRRLIESQIERPVPRPEKQKPLRKYAGHKRTSEYRLSRRDRYTPVSGVRIQVEEAAAPETSEDGSQADGDMTAQPWNEMPWRQQPWRDGPSQPRSRFERASSIALSDMSSMSASTTMSTLADGSRKVYPWWKSKIHPEKRMKLLPVAHMGIIQLKKECIIRGIWVHTVASSAAAFAEALIDPTWTGIDEFGDMGKGGNTKAKFHSPKAINEIDFGPGNWVQRGIVLRFIPEGQKYGYYWEDDPVVLVAGYNAPRESEHDRGASGRTLSELERRTELGTGMRSVSEPAARQTSLSEFLTRTHVQRHWDGDDVHGSTMSEVLSHHNGNNTRITRSAYKSRHRPQNEVVDLTFDDNPPHISAFKPSPAAIDSNRQHVSRSEPTQEVNYDPEFPFRLRSSRTPDPSRAVPKWVEEMLEEEGMSVPLSHVPLPPPPLEDEPEPEPEPPMDHETVQPVNHESAQPMDYEPAPQTENKPEPRIKQESPLPNGLESTPLVEYETPIFESVAPPEPMMIDMTGPAMDEEHAEQTRAWQPGSRPPSVSSTEYVPSEAPSEERHGRHSARRTAPVSHDHMQAEHSGVAEANADAQSEPQESDTSSEGEVSDRSTKSLFHTDAMIHLSRSFFLNSSEPSLQWYTYINHYPIPRKLDGKSTGITAPPEGPAIFRSTYNAFGAIVRELTRKLVYSSYHHACIRMRGEDDIENPPAKIAIVKDADVHAAIDVLGLARDSREYWVNWAERHESGWEYSFEARNDGIEGISIPVAKALAVQCLRLGREGEEEGDILRMVLAGREEALSGSSAGQTIGTEGGDQVKGDGADDIDTDEKMEDDSESEMGLKDDPEDVRRDQEIDEMDERRGIAATRQLFNLLQEKAEKLELDRNRPPGSTLEEGEDQQEIESGTSRTSKEIQMRTTPMPGKQEDTKNDPSDAETSCSSSDDSSTSSDEESSSDEDDSDNG